MVGTHKKDSGKVKGGGGGGWGCVCVLLRQRGETPGGWGVSRDRLGKRPRGMSLWPNKKSFFTGILFFTFCGNNILC